MWLHTPKPPGPATAGALTLAHEFELWLLASGKPTLTRSSEVDWAKAPWLHTLDLWEPHAAQLERVRGYLGQLAGERRLRTLGLCAGYGGLEMAVHMACEGNARTVGYVERQAYAAAVLASRMKEGALDEAPIWDDLETFDCGPWRGHVDLVAGGIPCQGASVAGSRKGVEDERWLWPVFWRIVQETGAKAFFLENVPGLLSVNGGGAFAQILGDVGARGWALTWDCVPAASVGAPHLRDRLFLLAADPDRVRVRLEPERDQRQGRGERAPQRGHAELVGDGPDRDASDADGKRRRRKGRGHVHAGQPDVERRGEVAADADHKAGEPDPGTQPHPGRARRDPANGGIQHQAPDADHEPASAEHELQPGQRADLAARGGEDASDAPRFGLELRTERDGGRSRGRDEVNATGRGGEAASDTAGERVQAGEPGRRAERDEGRATTRGGGQGDDPDAARLGRDEGVALDADALGQGGSDAGRGGEHGAPTDPAGLECAPGRRQEQLALGTDAERDGRRGRAARQSAADAGGAGPQGDGKAGTTADRDRKAGRTRAPSVPDSYGCEGVGCSRELDEGERSQLGGDADRRGGEGAGLADALGLGAGARDQLGRIVAAGRDIWDWERAPPPIIRSLDDGSSDRLVGDTHSDELHLLGNGVVPASAAYAFVVLWDRLIGAGADLDVPDRVDDAAT